MFSYKLQDGVKAESFTTYMLCLWQDLSVLCTNESLETSMNRRNNVKISGPKFFHNDARKNGTFRLLLVKVALQDDCLGYQ